MKQGHLRFPKVAVAASIVLGKPYHNGFQERVFSTGTWSDGKLKQRMTSDNLELSVLDKVNSDRCAKLLASIVELKIEKDEISKNFIEDFFSKATADTGKDVLTQEDITQETIEAIETVELNLDDSEAESDEENEIISESHE